MEIFESVFSIAGENLLLQGYQDALKSNSQSEKDVENKLGEIEFHITVRLFYAEAFSPALSWRRIDTFRLVNVGLERSSSWDILSISQQYVFCKD